MQGIKRHHKLLIWAGAVGGFGVVNASIYANSGSVPAAVLGFLSAFGVVGFLGWSEGVRIKKGQH